MTSIIHVTAPAGFGGLERVVSGLARAQVERGHRVALVMALSPSASVPEWAAALGRDGVVVEPLFVGDRSYLAERRAVRAAVTRFRADVMHTHGSRSDVLHLGAARALGVRVVSTAHGFITVGSKGKLYRWLQLRAWRRFDAVVAVSAALRDTLVAEGVAPDRIALIRNGLVPVPALYSRTEARTLLGIPANAPAVAWVGRLSEEKAPLLALDAFARLSDRSAHLTFIGEGPLRSALLQRATELGVGDRVRADGSRSDAAELLPAFDALLLSSQTEGTPMVILEAAMAGVPIVATSVGGVPDVVGTDALTVPAGDAVALADALAASLTDRHAAEERARRLGARLRSADAAEDWVGRYLALYEGS
jgi:glycosyltransferase involved in cell wall biosynthesis